MPWAGYPGGAVSRVLSGMGGGGGAAVSSGVPVIAVQMFQGITSSTAQVGFLVNPILTYP